MKHYEIEISQFMDNELPADEQKNLFAHLSECGECAKVLSDFLNIKMDVKSVYDDMNVELKNSSAVLKADESLTMKRNVYKTLFYYTAAASVIFGFFLFFLEGNQSVLENKYLILQKERVNLQNKYAVILNEKQQLIEMNKNYFD
ncbi:MAG: zf-HC2 domain-containing protein, partial [Ignavibacteria bacterium]|nr:zf-HC2 domain-containing protein [Ignavibacteria bacterium]